MPLRNYNLIKGLARKHKRQFPQSNLAETPYQ